MAGIKEIRSTFNLRARLDEINELPPLASLRGYKLSYLPHDFLAGLLIAALSIPIAMGYAQIAGLSPVYGLYASILPAIIFAIITSTRNMVFGMDSACAAVTGSVVVGAGVALGSDEAFAMMPLLTLLVALFLLIFALTRVGNLVHYVPEPVMHGFILGISIMIIFRQIPGLVGAPGLDLLDLASFASQINVPSLVLSVFALVTLFFLHVKAPSVPGPLVVLAFGMAFSVGFGLDSQGVVVLGEMPTGIPELKLPTLSAFSLVVMVSGAFSIAITCAMESLLALNTFSMREGVRAHGNRELVSFALGNVGACSIGCPPCSASLSRTAAAVNAGGKSQLAGVFGALIIAAFVLVLAPYLRYLPQPVLCAIVAYVMVNVIDFSSIRRYIRKTQIELAALIVVAVAVIAFGAIIGVAAGIVVSLITQLYRFRVSGEEHLVGLESDAPLGATRVPSNMVVIRVRGIFSFTNVDQELEEAQAQIGEGIDTVIFDITGISGLDATAGESFRRYVRTLRDQGMNVRIVRSLALANDQYTTYELRRIMKHAAIYPSVQSAINDVNRTKRKKVLDLPIDENGETANGMPLPKNVPGDGIPNHAASPSVTWLGTPTRQKGIPRDGIPDHAKKPEGGAADGNHTNGAKTNGGPKHGA